MAKPKGVNQKAKWRAHSIRLARYASRVQSVYDTLNDDYPEYADNGKNYAYLLEAGKTYEINVYSSNGMGYPVTVTVSSTHLHADEDDDGYGGNNGGMDNISDYLG